jgi:hypothetical protein
VGRDGNLAQRERIFEMTPHDTANFWPLFILVGVPVIVLTGGPYGWRFLILLGTLAALASHPLITGAVIVLYLLRTPLRWAAEGFIFGFTGGIGARLSGVFGSPERAERQRERWLARRRRERGAPRARGRRPQNYFPWQGDNLPEAME